MTELPYEEMGLAGVETATEQLIPLPAGVTGWVAVIVPSAPATTAGVIAHALIAAGKRLAVPSCLAAAAVMETWSGEECFSFAAAAIAAASSVADRQTGRNCWDS